MNATRTIYDIGYGVSTQQEFINRLKDAFPDGDAMIVDVRREGSGSRNSGTWANWGDGMRDTVEKSGNKYWSIAGLSNTHGKTKAGLLEYVDSITNGWRKKYLTILINMILRDTNTKFCLLCTERKPYTCSPSKGTDRPTPYDSTYGGEWSGNENCHRIVLSANILGILYHYHDEDWEAIHLYSERKE